MSKKQQSEKKEKKKAGTKGNDLNEKRVLRQIVFSLPTIKFFFFFLKKLKNDLYKGKS